MASNSDEIHNAVEEHSTVFRDLMLGFVRVHLLHHASVAPIYGSGIQAELERHGYQLSWGTLYPLLHNLAAEGFLRGQKRVVGGRVRKYYQITPLGVRALREAHRKARELVAETADAEFLAERVPVGDSAQGSGGQPGTPAS